MCVNCSLLNGQLLLFSFRSQHVRARGDSSHFYTAMPSTITDYADIQQNEIGALSAIFMEDFEGRENKVGAWNVCNNGLHH